MSTTAGCEASWGVPHADGYRMLNAGRVLCSYVASNGLRVSAAEPADGEADERVVSGTVFGGDGLPASERPPAHPPILNVTIVAVATLVANRRNKLTLPSRDTFPPAHRRSCRTLQQDSRHPALAFRIDLANGQRGAEQTWMGGGPEGRPPGLAQSLAAN